MSRDQPLIAEIKDDQLQIRVGLDTLKFAAERSPNDSLCWYDDKTGEYVSHKVIDTDEFGEDVRQALLKEAEDGTTPLHLLLDAACVDAIENGSEAVEEEPTPTLW